MTKFKHPTKLTDAEIAFSADVSKLMPARHEIPEEFKFRSDGIWSKFQERWFFRGLPAYPKAKEGIDLDTALRHLNTIQRSFEPKHEHKEEAVAYLASLWLDEDSVRAIVEMPVEPS